MSASVIITGAAGFLGGAVARELGRRGYRIIAVDVFGSDARWRNLAGVPLADVYERDEFLHRIRTRRQPPLPVVHLGACSSTTEPDVGFLLRNNFAYTRTLAQWCLESGVRLVYASSAATYAAGAEGYSDDLERLPRLQPANAYAFSKHAFDLWAWHHGAFRGPGAIAGLKYFNVYGPDESHKGEMRSMALKAYEQLRATGSVKLFRSYRPGIGNGEQTRDFVFVDDAVRITVWFLEHPEATGLFNVGSGVARTWNDLVRAVGSALRLVPKIEYVAMPSALIAGYQYTTCADLTRLKQAGCEPPRWNLEKGIAEYVRWLERAEGSCDGEAQG